MNWVSTFAEWCICKLDHIPIVGVVLGEANLAFKILALLFLAGTIFWAKRKWGEKRVANPDDGMFSKAGTVVHNLRASVVGSVAMVGTFAILISVFATGMLGYGKMLDLHNGPTVLPSNNYQVDYVRDISCKGQAGKKMILHQPNGPGAWDTEHPILVFIPNASLSASVKIAEGSIISIANFQNRYKIGDAVPDADPDFRRASL